MDSLTPTTALEAVNMMLATIDESPVNSLEDSGLVDAVLAVQQLTATSRKVQAKGWHWNTELEFRLARDPSNGEIAVPKNTLKLVPTGADKGRIVTIRGTRLYDPVNHTFSFPAGLTANLIVFLSFDELPETARQFIALSACRKFQQTRVGSEILNSFSMRDEVTAWSDLLNDEGEIADYNVITDNPSMVEMLFR